MRRFLLALAAAGLLLACTGRTPPANLPRPSGSNVVDAGRVDAGGLPTDASVGDDLYGPCTELADCPASAARCTVERAGVCNPTCSSDGTCPEIGGKAGICVGDGTIEWCVLPCGEDFDCPDDFVCSTGGTCVRS